MHIVASSTEYYIFQHRVIASFCLSVTELAISVCHHFESDLSCFVHFGLPLVPQPYMTSADMLPQMQEEEDMKSTSDARHYISSSPSTSFSWPFDISQLAEGCSVALHVYRINSAAILLGWIARFHN